MFKIFIRQISSKQGNKNYYKGNRGGRMGRWTRRGNYIIEKSQLREFVVPDLSSKLTAFTSPKMKSSRGEHTVCDYFEGENWEGTNEKGEACLEEAKRVMAKLTQPYKYKSSYLYLGLSLPLLTRNPMASVHRTPHFNQPATQ
jgi:large subunit ribosomal protein L41